jgi:hypothetical protein
MNVQIQFGTDLNDFDKATQNEVGALFRKDLPAGTVMWQLVNHNPDVTARRFLWFVCPCGCGNCSHIPIKMEKQDGWVWDGNEQQPTLSPSIQKLISCRWHGYLRAGVFQSC